MAEAARASWGEETAALSARIDELELQLTGAAEALAASRAAQEADEAQASQVQEVLRAESDALRQTLAAAQADLQAAQAAHEVGLEEACGTGPSARLLLSVWGDGVESRLSTRIVTVLPAV